MSKFDICIITASDSRQASIFKKLIEKRKKRELYPREIVFKVYPDPENGRIGSGGGTIWALRKLVDEEQVEKEQRKQYFSSKKILIIHAGGESRRLPCYAPEGKLFAPVPVPSSTVTPPVVLDVLLSLYFAYPWRTGEVLVSSGDVIIDFDLEALIKPDTDVFGFTKPATLEQGSRHGVYRFDPYLETVEDFYQKNDIDFLRENARLEGTNECALDIGIISMNPDFILSLLTLSEIDFGEDADLYQQLKNGKVYIDIYLELITACLKNLSFEKYLNKIGQKSSLSEDQLRIFYNKLNRHVLGGVVTKNTTFLHFGNLKEYPESCRRLVQNMITPFYCGTAEEIVPFCTQETILYNSTESILGDSFSNKNVFGENLQNVNIQNPLGNNLIIGLNDFKSRLNLPDGICIDERNIDGKRIHVVYSIIDNFKKSDSISELTICGVPAEKWLKERELDSSFLWENNKKPDFYEAKLYCEGDEVFLEGYYQTPKNIKSWKQIFIDKPRYSIKELNTLSSAFDREEQREAKRKKLLREKILSDSGFKNIPKADFSMIFNKDDTEELHTILLKTDEPMLREYRKELLKDYIDVNEDKQHDRIVFYKSYKNRETITHKIKNDQIVWARSPARIDLAGGWTDTPPYTNREGGVVVNVAVNLNGQPPVQVFIRPTQRSEIVFHSIDLGVTERVPEISGLLDYYKDSGPFSLAKAALTLLLDLESDTEKLSLKEIIHSIGSGIEITLLCAVPKGSGLGTSSILAGTILAALQKFFGIETTQNELFLQVLEIEQMLTTGGGWQDQIGGLVGGVKYIETKPGLRPQPVIHQLDTYLFENPNYLSRMSLYYTGITRLAKNILQDIVSMSNSKNPAYLYTLRYLKELASDAREAIGLRDYDMLAKTIKNSWEANKLMHYSTTNDEIEDVLNQLSPHYSGMKLFGAGGGGFGLFLSKTVEEAEELRNIIKDQVQNKRARILEMSLNKEGLVVTVS